MPEGLEEAVTTTIPIAQVRTDGGTQPRAGLDQDTLEEYTALVKRKYKNFPPIEVVYDGNEYWLWDGFHRFEAFKQAKKKDIKANVQQGTITDAQWLSYAANRTNGLRRSNEDKQRAVQAALRHSPERSDQVISDHVGVDRKTIAAHRKKLEEAREIPITTERVGADERVYEVPKSDDPEASDQSDEGQDADQSEEPPAPDQDKEIDQNEGAQDESAGPDQSDGVEQDAALDEGKGFTDALTQVSDEIRADAENPEQEEEVTVADGDTSGLLVPGQEPTDGDEPTEKSLPEDTLSGQEPTDGDEPTEKSLPEDTLSGQEPTDGDEPTEKSLPEATLSGQEPAIAQDTGDPLAVAPVGVASPLVATAMTAQLATMLYHQAMAQWNKIAPGDDIWQSVNVDRDILERLTNEVLMSSCVQTAVAALAQAAVVIE
jgi:DNA-binding MarR family transcriptional regulator